MPWYAVSLLYKSEHSVITESDPLWEERILLINAPGEDVAKNKGKAIGMKGQHEYLGLSQDKDGVKDKIRWTFMQIERIHAIEDEVLVDGTEVFSRFLRDSEVRSLLTPFED